jgi:hypothetical protein
MTHKWIIDGDKFRFDSICTDPTENPIGISMISDGTNFYLSDAYKKDTIEFYDYKTFSDIESVKPMRYESNMQTQEDAPDDILDKYYEFTFLPDDEQHKNEYIIKFSVKDKQNTLKELRAKKDLSEYESAVFLAASFDSIIYIDKNTFFINRLDIQSDFKDYKNETKKEAMTINSSKEFSNYKLIPGKKDKYCPYRIKSLVSTVSNGEKTETKIEHAIKSLKSAASKDVAAFFTPSNTISGVGKIPKEYQKTVIQTPTMKGFSQDYKKTITDGIKEGAKNQMKNMFRRGLLGF